MHADRCRLAAPLVESWSERYGAAVWNLPLIADGILVRQEPHSRAVAGYQEASPNTRLWQYKTGSAPILHGGLVVVYSERGRLDWVDLRSGSLVGTVAGPGPLEAAVVDDVVVGQGFDSVEGDCLFGSKYLEGETRWRFHPAPNTRIRGVFCGSGGAAFLGLDDSSVLSVSVRDGQLIWRASVSDLEWNDPTFGARPGVPEGILTLSRNPGLDVLIVRVQHGHVVGLSSRDGRRAWVWRCRRGRTDDGYLYDGRYYVNSGLGTYHVLDPLTGRELLSADLRATLPKKLDGLVPHGSMLISDTHAYIGTIEGYIVAFERETGAYSWHHRPRGGTGMGSYLMSANGRLYYTDMSFRLYCLEEENPTDPVLMLQKEKGQLNASNR